MDYQRTTDIFCKYAQLTGTDIITALADITTKIAGQKGSDNNNYKGPGKRGYSADHKAAAKKIKAKKCSRCGSTKDIQRAVVHGSNGKKFISLCRSCHAKYDNMSKNFNKKGE